MLSVMIITVRGAQMFVGGVCGGGVSTKEEKRKKENKKLDQTRWIKYPQCGHDNS